ncbi:hypothetical protein Pst134EA_019295 [Puccinia striiformis f. sp. tritici]|uniref:hypothetical protein n=1 Tax=Puccinia striiformis f. sp. tritici TaxID=168172 RepID=UPI0020076A9F|nr:hypothetical protein Pst134EA_019295 [Puccinia striiformis f. sp. tritici]KAH9459140.1 hypothetical protein Pst134EA_019295 [Puccinia striiformis f. sp. tritici]
MRYGAIFLQYITLVLHSTHVPSTCKPLLTVEAPIECHSCHSEAMVYEESRPCGLELICKDHQSNLPKLTCNHQVSIWVHKCPNHNWRQETSPRSACPPALHAVNCPGPTLCQHSKILSHL